MSTTIAMITEVFPGQADWLGLETRLHEAASGGAVLAVLPELGMDRWVPADRQARDADAEVPGGPRQRALAEAAAGAGIAVMGGAIVRDPATGERRNRALLVGSGGEALASYDKIHVPWEAGYWERDHYGAGHEPPVPIRVGSLSVGLQICSDLQRPSLIFALAAAGVDVVLAPRCTPTSSYERWRRVIRGIAMMTGTYIVSVNRPCAEAGVPIGGPSIAAGPDGTILVESHDPVALVDVEPERVTAARSGYPGYLAWPSDVYSKAWSRLAPVAGPGEAAMDDS